MSSKIISKSEEIKFFFKVYKTHKANKVDIDKLV